MINVFRDKILALKLNIRYSINSKCTFGGLNGNKRKSL